MKSLNKLQCITICLGIVVMNKLNADKPVYCKWLTQLHEMSFVVSKLWLCINYNIGTCDLIHMYADA